MDQNERLASRVDGGGPQFANMDADPVRGRDVEVPPGQAIGAGGVEKTHRNQSADDNSTNVPHR